MSKAETAIKLFETYNCAQSVFTAYAEDFGISKNQALSLAVGFGAGMGRTQDVCGAVSGAIMVLGLSSEFKDGDGRDKIDAVYSKVRHFLADFSEANGTIKCRDLIDCNLLSEEGQKYFKENNLKEKCRGYVRFCCELLDKVLDKAL